MLAASQHQAENETNKLVLLAGKQHIMNIPQTPMQGCSGAEEWLNDGVFVTCGDTAWLGELLVSCLAATGRHDHGGLPYM